MTEVAQNARVLEAWVQPEIEVLAVEETAGFTGTGADGGGNPDCTRS